MSTAVERNILTVVEPAIMLDPMEMPDVESGESGLGTIKEKPSKFLGMAIPLIRINTYEVQTDRLISFNLNLTGFVPTMSVSFEDRDTLFMSRYFPKDGDVIQLNIRSQGEETTFKPIRIDFTITDCYPIGGNTKEAANKWRVEGKMLVPNLYNEFTEFYEGTSWNSLLGVAEALELGYASNVEDTADDMVWINPNDTREKFIQDVVANSYLDDEHFFQAYIDPYYYLSLVDINRLFSQEGAIEASQGFSTNAGDIFEQDNSGEQDDFPNYLSNLVQMQGSSRYLGKYQMINNTGEISNANGYKRYAQWWALPDKEFISEFVDPLTSNTPGMIPLKGRFVGPPGGKIPEGIADTQTRYKYLGKQSENTYTDFMYSVVQNYQNNQEIHKMGMTVELDTINPALLRYTRIYCYIVEYATPTQNTLTAVNNADDEGTPHEDAAQRESTAEQDAAAPFVTNDFLSGFYVIGGMEYIYREPGPMRMRLHLLRREFYPST
jgi:hypothetical protein